MWHLCSSGDAVGGTYCQLGTYCQPDGIESQVPRRRVKPSLGVSVQVLKEETTEERPTLNVGPAGTKGEVHFSGTPFSASGSP